MLKKIYIKNFKSYLVQELDFGQINIIIGANASGKSNLIQAINLIKNIKEIGLKETITNYGGRFIKNIDSDENFVLFKLIYEPGTYLVKHNTIDNKEIRYCIEQVIYELKIINTIEDDFFIDSEKISTTVQYKEFFINKSKEETLTNLFDPFTYGILNEKGSLTKFPKTVRKNFEYEDGNETIHCTLENPIPVSLFDYVKKDMKNTSLLEIYNDFIPQSIYNYSVYDLDAKLAKKGEKKFPTHKLTENGDNLQKFLSVLFENSNIKENFIEILNFVLNFADNIEIKSISKENSMFSLFENFHNKKEYSIPSPLLSEGTINVTAIIAALFYVKTNLDIFEEIDKGIHPSVVSRLMTVLYDASTIKQIILTTHNPVVLKNTKLEDIYLVTRSEEQPSFIRKPSDSKVVQAFLKNDLGIDYLFENNYIEEV